MDFVQMIKDKELLLGFKELVTDSDSAVVVRTIRVFSSAYFHALKLLSVGEFEDEDAFLDAWTTIKSLVDTLLGLVRSCDREGTLVHLIRFTEAAVMGHLMHDLSAFPEVFEKGRDVVKSGLKALKDLVTTPYIGGTSFYVAVRALISIACLRPDLWEPVTDLLKRQMKTLPPTLFDHNVRSLNKMLQKNLFRLLRRADSPELKSKLIEMMVAVGVNRKDVLPWAPFSSLENKKKIERTPTPPAPEKKQKLMHEEYVPTDPRLLPSSKTETGPKLKAIELFNKLKKQSLEMSNETNSKIRKENMEKPGKETSKIPDINEIPLPGLDTNQRFMDNSSLSNVNTTAAKDPIAADVNTIPVKTSDVITIPVKTSDVNTIPVKNADVNPIAVKTPDVNTIPAKDSTAVDVNTISIKNPITPNVNNNQIKDLLAAVANTIALSTNKLGESQGDSSKTTSDNMQNLSLENKSAEVKMSDTNLKFELEIYKNLQLEKVCTIVLEHLKQLAENEPKEFLESFKKVGKNVENIGEMRFHTAKVLQNYLEGHNIHSISHFAYIDLEKSKKLAVEKASTSKTGEIKNTNKIVDTTGSSASSKISSKFRGNYGLKTISESNSQSSASSTPSSSPPLSAPLPVDVDMRKLMPPAPAPKAKDVDMRIVGPRMTPVPKDPRITTPAATKPIEPPKPINRDPRLNRDSRLQNSSVENIVNVSKDVDHRITQITSANLDPRIAQNRVDTSLNFNFPPMPANRNLMQTPNNFPNKPDDKKIQVSRDPRIKNSKQNENNNPVFNTDPRLQLPPGFVQNFPQNYQHQQYFRPAANPLFFMHPPPGVVSQLPGIIPMQINDPRNATRNFSSKN